MNVKVTCTHCERLYIFKFRRGTSPLTAANWLRSAGWIIVGPPVRFFCAENCHAAEAIDITPARLPAS